MFRTQLKKLLHFSWTKQLVCSQLWGNFSVFVDIFGLFRYGFIFLEILKQKLFFNFKIIQPYFIYSFLRKAEGQGYTLGRIQTGCKQSYNTGRICKLHRQSMHEWFERSEPWTLEVRGSRATQWASMQEQIWWNKSYFLCNYANMHQRNDNMNSVLHSYISLPHLQRNLLIFITYNFISEPRTLGKKHSPGTLKPD